MSEVLTPQRTFFFATPNGVQLEANEMPSLPYGYCFSTAALAYAPETARLLHDHYPSTSSDSTLTASVWKNDSRYYWNHGYELIDVGVETTDSQLVGFGRAVIKNDNGEFCDFVVHSEHRRRGIGTAIILARFRLARKAGVRALWIPELDETNTRLHVYKSLGFKECEDKSLEFNPEHIPIYQY